MKRMSVLCIHQLDAKLSVIRFVFVVSMSAKISYTVSYMGTDASTKVNVFTLRLSAEGAFGH